MDEKEAKMETKNEKIEREAWFLLHADDEDVLDEMQREIAVRGEVNYVAARLGVEVFWTEETRDTGFGQERKAILYGKGEDIDQLLSTF
jgi:hypothetical protein